ncbi:MAG: glycoside hydrolase family 127 protein [Phycisphaerales bacterium]|nr:glycoside hydrolase family 127 protein [Phycisphaerales bacterium]
MAQPLTLTPEQAPPAVADKQDAQTPDRVHLSGWLGSRIEANATNRLEILDTDRLLEGYRHRPGRQAWDGEHVGKWLHAATLAWAYTGDAALRAKLDETAAELCRCQLADGYLGTYLDRDRWTEWDVWAHKYNLIGLVTYMRYTGDLSPMPTCRRMADLLCDTFGDAPGMRDIIAAGHHVGMAPTSVLEPMALLYRLTGEPRYLEFCRYILRAWEQPNGPHIVSRLLAGDGVDKVGNGKAYEMLSCLNGALEFYRTTGEQPLLDATLAAWRDIVANRLYITGASSYCELFHEADDFPNNNNVGETCVTVTWLQLNAQLLRLTGEARFADQLEHVALNQLLGAQQPDGSAWGYYVQMEGKKPYSAALDGHCCLSSGPRGIALIPTFAVTTDGDGVVVNLFDPGVSHLTLRDGTPVTLEIDTRYPAEGQVRIVVRVAGPHEFALKVRVPDWCTHSSITPEGATQGPDGYTALRRVWTSGDAVELHMQLSPRIVLGDHLNRGRAALCYGPLVLAADEGLLASVHEPLNALALPEEDAVSVSPAPAPPDRSTWPGAQVFRIAATTRDGAQAFTAELVPFADAGMAGDDYRVWIPLAGEPNANLLLAGVESRSREGNVAGSINDDDLRSIVTTFDGNIAEEDWFAVTLAHPVTARRVTFTHGKNFHDGGWFDTSRGRSRVQIRRPGAGDWTTIGELEDYPPTTAAVGQHDRLTWSDRQFTLRLEEPATFTAVRVVGTPSYGDNPSQAFSSCAELQAFPD